MFSSIGELETHALLAQQAMADGKRYSSLYHWLHALLSASADERDHVREKSAAIILPWAFDCAPVAYLGCFTKIEGNYICELKQGTNRLGRSPQMADHTIPSSVHLMEERQWLILHGYEGRTLVAGNRSSSSSVLLDCGSPVLAGSPSLADLRLAKPSVEIDRSGDVLHPLSDGDVLVTFYGAFVFAERKIPPTLAAAR